MAATKHRTTRQGGAVEDALRTAGGFRSAQDVYAALRTTGGSVGLSTVYRHLQALADGGQVDAIQSPDGETTYRYCGGPDTGHHHHLVCRMCGRAEEVEGLAVERWATSVADAHGYTDVDHTVELFGTCAACTPR
ncbi:MAG: Fur family transcriptional regulator, ferric uptake regulator [Pseudonocardiales bacterium]|jgi:Fur family ferric uptake transcriptional regulator|nr:Fur family transcriptional regulator, ferric uptake regulator [Pseudonocardiales bacterium]